MLFDYQQTLAGIQSSASDDCVRILTENGKGFGATREQVRKLRDCLDGEAITVLRQGRRGDRSGLAKTRRPRPLAGTSSHRRGT